LKLSWPSDTCYAGELYEHPQHQGQGVGLALLAFSLAETKRRGYRRQVSWVTAHNTKMLSGSLQLMGFTKIGRIDIRRVFRRPFSTWDIGGRAGRGGTVIL
jgi:GNAT superfamily N-acetyltransferase